MQLCKCRSNALLKPLCNGQEIWGSNPACARLKGKKKKKKRCSCFNWTHVIAHSLQLPHSKKPAFWPEDLLGSIKLYVQ